MDRSIAIPLLAALLLSQPGLAANQAVTVRLVAQSNSGQNGTATLSAEGDKTRVVIELANVPAGVPQPAHIHRGTCDRLDKAPKWSLKPVEAGRSVSLLPVSLKVILKEPNAINVHKSALETQVYVSCGNIARP